MTELLAVDEVRSGYAFLQVLHSVSLKVDQGEFVALLGPNGAGKSTLLRTIAGFNRAESGKITFAGQSIGNLAPHRISRLGIALVSESLNLFPGMTVYENLALGAYSKSRRTRARLLEDVLALFPRLAERTSQRAGTLSGGERKMVAVGRALMAEPQLLLVDEPSLGLAPLMAQAVFLSLRALSQSGRTILMVEQNVAASLRLASRAYILEQGQIRLEGKSNDLESHPLVRRVYLGIGPES